jgi:hypothetical protein
MVQMDKRFVQNLYKIGASSYTGTTYAVSAKIWVRQTDHTMLHSKKFLLAQQYEKMGQKDRPPLLPLPLVSSPPILIKSRPAPHEDGLIRPARATMLDGRDMLGG